MKTLLDETKDISLAERNEEKIRKIKAKNRLNINYF